MDKIIIKEYEWGKFTRIRYLVSSLIYLALTVLFLTNDNIYIKICSLVLSIGVIIMFVQYFYMLKNKIFIQVANDGLKISPNILDLVFSSKVVEWKDISSIKKNPSQITLILTKGGVIKIQLAFLNKDDRDNLAQIIQEYVNKNKLTT